MSLLQEPDTTRIQRLTVQGPAAARERLLPQLETQRWPAPSDGSWVLVRQVTASADPGQLAGELIERARQKINIGDPAEVVRFPTLAALLAELICDLLNGTAAQRWYWRDGPACCHCRPVMPFNSYGRNTPGNWWPVVICWPPEANCNRPGSNYPGQCDRCSGGSW